MTDTQTQTERTIAIGSIEDAIAWCEAEADRIKGDLYQRPSDFRLIASLLASQSAEIERLKGEYVHQDLLFDAQDRVLGDEDWRWQRDYGGIITIAIGNPMDGWETYQSARHVATDPLAFISALLSALSQKDTHNG